MTDRIRLNEKGIRAYHSKGGSTHGPGISWHNRTGTIAKYNRSRSLAYVIWDGNRSFDRVPVGLIEPCAPTADHALG